MESEKLCFDCKTSKTPLWRSGPAGPKSLCNACGIRYRKKSVTKSDKKKEKQEPSQLPSPSTSSTTDDVSSRKRENGGELRKKLRVKVVGMGMGKEVVMMQGPRSPMKKVKRMGSDEYQMMRRRKFGEVEEAAYLLMCLSCG